MNETRNIAIACLCALAFCATGAVRASAHEFKTTVTGKITGKATTNQVFKAGFGEVACTKVTPTGKVEKAAPSSIEISDKYENCKYTIFGTETGEATLSSASYGLLGESSLSILHTAISINLSGSGCAVTIPSGQSLSGVSYENKGSDLVVNNKVENIDYALENAGAKTCPKKEEGTAATYEGGVEIGVEGATIGWSSTEHEFKSTVGKTKGIAATNQVIKGGFGEVTCSKLSASSELEAGFHASAAISLKYAGCKYSVLGGILTGEATASLADYTFFAEPLLSILKVILVDFQGELKGCSLTLFEQTLGGNAGEISYENKSGGVAVKDKLRNIAYSLLNVSGSEKCATTETGSNAAYEGTIEFGIEGGSLEWT